MGPENLSAMRSVASAKKPARPEVGHDHHHAEEQDDRLVIDGPGGVLHRQDAGGEHGGRPDQGDPGPVDPQAGDLAEGQGKVGQAEDRRDQRDRGPGASSRLVMPP